MHTTGTDSLQRTLSGVKNPIDWQYLDVRNYINLSVPFFSMFAPDPTSYHWFGKKGLSRADAVAQGELRKAEIKNTIQTSRSEQFIISGEGISLLDRQGVDSLHEFFTPLFDDIRIIAYIRSPIAFRVSMFQQRLKSGRAKFDVVDAPLNYQNRFGKFDEVFGSERVHLWKFEPDRFPTGCVVADLCQRIGVQLPAGSLVVPPNESLTREACGILYAYRKLGGGYGVGSTVIKENRGVIDALLAMSGEELKISRFLSAKAMKHDEVSVAWMEDRLGESLRENIESDWGGISSEADLLTITQSACRAFVTEFEALYGLKVSARHMPGTDPADPQAVANLFEHCRALYRESLVSIPHRRPSSLAIKPKIGDDPDIYIGNGSSVSTQTDDHQFSMSDLVNTAIGMNREVLAAMSKKRARALIEGVFSEIVERLEPLPHDMEMHVSGLGEFRATAAHEASDTKQNPQNSILFVPQDATVAIDTEDQSTVTQGQWIAKANKLERLARLTTHKASEQTFCDLVKAYRMANMPNEALAATVRGLEHYSDHVALMNEAVLAAMAARDWVRAREMGQSLAMRRTGSLDARLGLCIAHQMVGEYECSAEQLEWCLKTHAAELARDYSSGHTKTILFDNGETRIEFYKKLKQTNSLFVTFDSQGKENQGNKPPFAYDFLKNLDVDIVAVRFWKERSFLQDLSVEDFTSVVGSMIGCYVRKVAYGTSIGGYGALYFGSAIGCDILAMAPRNSNHPVYGGTRTPKRFRFNHNLEMPPSDSPNVTILFDPNEKMDKKYVDLGLKPRMPNARFVEFPYAGHYIANFLLSTGILKQVVLDAFNREVKPKYPRKNRQKAPHYLANLGVACLKRGKPKWASDLFQRVASKFPNNDRAAKRIEDALKESCRQGQIRSQR